MVMLVFWAAGTAYAGQGAAEGKGPIPMGYELYSWQKSNGEWAFCLLGMTDREKTIGEVFDKKATLHGVRGLRQRIARLPEHLLVVWYDRLTSGPGLRAKGSERLRYPPPGIVEQVRHFAAKRGIKVSGP